MLIKDFATIIQGHQITDEEIYYSAGEIPIYTGSNDTKGFWNKSIIEKEDLPCISYPTKGNSGVTFIHNEIFDANNTALILIKDEFKREVNLEWLAYVLRPVLKRYMTNNEGVSYLNKELVENIDLVIPDEEIQRIFVEKFRGIEKFRVSYGQILDAVDELNSKALIFNTDDLPTIQL